MALASGSCCEKNSTRFGAPSPSLVGGSFGAHNTVLMDEMKQTSSHPDNVIPIPPWCWHEDDGSEMVKLIEYLDTLATAQPRDVAAYLREHPCPAFAPKAAMVAHTSVGDIGGLFQ